MADEIVKVIKIEAEGSEQSVKQLRQEIADLRDALLNTEKGSDQYNKSVEKLVAAQKKLNDVMAAGKDAFRTKKQELTALKNEMDNLVPGTQAYAAAFQRAADITHTLQERQEMLRYSAADLGTQMSNVVSIGSSLAAGFNAVQGVMALAGGKSEELQKTMMKLQAGIALVQGLQGLEGMTKRMKGFVAGVTEMVTHTGAAAAAVQAETTAIGANTVAQEANAVATTTATVATKAFSKALVATGIGAIVVLIGSLIAHWEDLKDMIGLSNEKLGAFTAIMDKAKEIIAGVSNVIFQYFIASVKNAITAVGTLGKVVKDLFTFNFSQLATDVKEGWQQINENTKKGLAISENYRSGAEKQRVKNAEKNARKLAEISAQELDDTIKDNEAKYGSDWKYTQDGKKLYDQYFATKLKAYKKDSKEYKDLMRQKWSYDREYQEHLNKASKAQVKQAKETTDKLLEEANKIEKRAIDSQKTELQLLEEKYKQEYDLLVQYNKDTTALTAEYEAAKKKIIEKENAETDKIVKRAQDYLKDELTILTETYEEEKKKLEEKEKDTTALTAEYEKKKTAILKRQAEERSNILQNDSSRKLQGLDDKNSQEVTRIELEYSLKEAQGTGVLNFADIIEETNRIYQANRENLQAQADEYKRVMESADADKELKIEAERNYNNTMAELRALDTQNVIDNLNLQKDAIKEQIQMYSDMAKSIGDIFGSIADILQEDIKNKIKNGQITQEEGEKQFEAVKAFQIAQATINTIAGAIAAFMSCQSTYPQPYGAIIGAIQAAAVSMAGIAQINKIRNTQLGGGNTVSSSMSAAAVQTQPEEYVPQYTQNATGESEITKLADSIRDQRVFVVESDITEAQNRSKVRVTESTW